MQKSISKIAAVVLTSNAVLMALLPALASERDNRALSERIYGVGKAALVWPDDKEGAALAAPQYANGRTLASYEGTVSRVRAADYFELRAVDGRIYRVIGQDENARFNVKANQHVQVRGYITQDILVAFSVQAVGYGGNSQVDFPGTVTSITGVARLEVRGDNGRTYTVDARTRLPYGISAGDYIRIAGAWDGVSVIASQVTILSNGSGSGGSGNRYVDFPGTVTDINGNSASVRGENGITYTVTYKDNACFAIFDRVRVAGYFDGYNVRATSIERL